MRTSSSIASQISENQCPSERMYPVSRSLTYWSSSLVWMSLFIFSSWASICFLSSPCASTRRWYDEVRSARRVVAHVMILPMMMPPTPIVAEMISVMSISLSCGLMLCRFLYNCFMFDRETVENVLLVMLSVFLVGVMAVTGFMIVTGLPAFARYLCIVWYVLTI